MRRDLVFLVMVIVALSANSVGAFEPPEEVLRRANAAFGVLQGRGFVGKYIQTSHARVSDPEDGEPKDSLEIEEVTIHIDGSRETRLLRVVEDGKDVTAERLASAKGHGKDKKNDKNEFDFELVPLGENAKNYMFSAPRRLDGLLVAQFRPITKAKSDDDDLGQGRGEIAWDSISGDPAWIEVRPDQNIPMSKIDFRMEFARSPSVIYTKLFRTKVRVGIPLILRLKIDIDIEISDLRPQSAVQSVETKTQ